METDEDEDKADERDIRIFNDKLTDRHDYAKIAEKMNAAAGLYERAVKYIIQLQTQLPLKVAAAKETATNELNAQILAKIDDINKEVSAAEIATRGGSRRVFAKRNKSRRRRN